MTSNLTVRELMVSTTSGGVEAGLQLPEMPALLATAMSGPEWQAMGARVLDLLDINVVDVLLGGWKAHREVRRELELTAADSARRAVVQLAHHSIESTHTPAIELRTHGRKLLELSFPLELMFEIEAVAVTVRRGAVSEVRPGGVKVRGTMQLENTVVLERELSELTLPGRITFDAPPTTDPPPAPVYRVSTGHGPRGTAAGT